MKKREKHGLTKHPLYSKWQDMRNRCKNKNVDRYDIYGGRGIEVCEDWNDSFKSFYDWCLSNDYKEGLSIERIDVNGGYNPSNCSFITLQEQHYNKTNSKMVFYKGKEVCFAELINILFPRCYSKAYSVIWHNMKLQNTDVLSIEMVSKYHKMYGFSREELLEIQSEVKLKIKELKA